MSTASSETLAREQGQSGCKKTSKVGREIDKAIVDSAGQEIGVLPTSPAVSRYPLRPRNPSKTIATQKKVIAVIKAVFLPIFITFRRSFPAIGQSQHRP